MVMIRYTDKAPDQRGRTATVSSSIAESLIAQGLAERMDHYGQPTAPQDAQEAPQAPPQPEPSQLPEALTVEPTEPQDEPVAMPADEPVSEPDDNLEPEQILPEDEDEPPHRSRKSSAKRSRKTH